jgi:ElaB/YqjD/DUF883 family membrane-anchored ribosome-binding protein
MQDSIQDTLNSVKQRLEVYAQEYQLEEKTRFYTNKAKETIQKHPIPSLVAGLAVGFLLGKLLSDSDESAE